MPGNAVRAIAHRRPGNDHSALRLVMADFARAMAMIIRAQLFGPGNHIVPGSRCNELFVMHGTVMLLLFAPLTPPPGRGRRVQVSPDYTVGRCAMRPGDV